MKKIILFGFVILFTSCATVQKTHTVERTTQKLELNINVENAYNLAYKTALEFSWVMTNSDTNMHAFGATTPVVLKRWDDDVNVFVEGNENNSIITVKSKLGHEPNVKYIESYLQAIKEKTAK